MPDANKTQWIEIGYELFSKEGPKGLKVELLARKAGKSKSSFYHHFGDLELFTDSLLQYHLERSIVISKQAASCQNMVPDLLNLLLSVKSDILFDRQLRIHRDVLEFKKCFEKASGQVEDAFLNIWSDSLGLGDKTYLARIILNLTVENFYLSVTDENINSEWLVNYLKEIHFMVREMMKK